MELTDNLPKRHVGRSVEKIRTYFGIKQSALGADIGLSQSEISHLEQQEEINDETLDKIAKSFGVSKELIKDFDTEKIIYQINHVTDHGIEQGATAIFQQFNPVEKIVELYERLLKSEREKIEILKARKE